MPEISIIVPVYNVEAYLEDCITSILNQTFKDFELILVDDSSTDKSGYICDQFAKIDRRIKVIHQKCGGASCARNLGLDNANGKYIGFVDSDDYIHPQMYEILYKNIIYYGVNIVMCNYKKVLEKEKFKKQCETIDNIVLYSNIEALNYFFSEDDYRYIPPWNKLYIKEIFEDIRFEEGKICEDQIISPKLIYISKSILIIEETLYFYRRRQGSVSNNGFDEKRLDLVHANWDNIRFFNKIHSPLKDKMEQIYIYYFFEYYFKGEMYFGKKNKNLVTMKKEFLRIFPILIKNKAFCKKEKISWILFFISPKLYKKLLKYHI